MAKKPKLRMRVVEPAPINWLEVDCSAEYAEHLKRLQEARRVEFWRVFAEQATKAAEVKAGPEVA